MQAIEHQAIEYRYNAILKPNQLVYGSGTVVIVAGWTPRDRVAKLISPEYYAAIGQLYSPEGIGILVRNLLANPHVTGLIILQESNPDRVPTSATQALVRFLETSTSIEGIPDKDVERVRKLEWQVLSELNTERLTAYAMNLTWSEPIGGIPVIYPMPKIESPVVPGHLYGHRIEGKTIAETWIKIVHRIRTTGVLRPTGYDGQWQELIDLMAVVTDESEGFYFPDPNYLPCDREFLTEYLSQVLTDNKVGTKYTYGNRMRSHFGVDQVEQVVQKLAGEKDAASAVISLWDVDDHNKGGSPCLNQVWLRIVNNALSLTAVLRSNDMFNAWPSNAFGLRALQMHIRDGLIDKTDWDLTLGPLVTLSQSAHLYDHSFAYADRVVEQHYSKERTTYSDPVGNYLVEVEGNEIVVTRMEPRSGKPVKQYRATNPDRLRSVIACDAPAMQVSHAIYLGQQIDRAWHCMKTNQPFFQD